MKGKKMKGLNFNFDEITGEAKTSPAVSKKKTESEEVKESSKELGVTLSVVVDGEMITKDITKLTHYEFVTWVRSVFPCHTLSINDCETIPKRWNIFKNIVAFNKEPILSKTRPKVLIH